MGRGGKLKKNLIAGTLAMGVLRSSLVSTHLKHYPPPRYIVPVAVAQPNTGAGKGKEEEEIKQERLHLVVTALEHQLIIPQASIPMSSYYL
jgi:hypothetical protein